MSIAVAKKVFNFDGVCPSPMLPVGTKIKLNSGQTGIVISWKEALTNFVETRRSGIIATSSFKRIVESYKEGGLFDIYLPYRTLEPVVRGDYSIFRVDFNRVSIMNESYG